MVLSALGRRCSQSIATDGARATPRDAGDAWEDEDAWVVGKSTNQTQQNMKNGDENILPSEIPNIIGYCLRMK